ncbi:MAG: glycoside hydrolase family 25 protein, partial [Lachnospiraceae bacterium]|nr:glycoside hydrolase family 25 protein [Lachnospiraceae bacterium]
STANNNGGNIPEPSTGPVPDFREDEFFFDPGAGVNDRPIPVAELVMSSVAKELTINIVDAQGRNIRGEEFSVSLEGIGEYRDSDQDGIIYIRSVPVGECRVTLSPHPDYRTPASASSIMIKQQIEYVAISASELRILTEDEIDVTKEDATNILAETDRDATEQTELLGSWEGAQMGIDVSKYNKEIDWERVKSAGIEFAIIRLGYRGYTSGALIIDPYFEVNIKGATDAGIPVGVYFFSQAVNEVEAVEEASMVIELCKDYRLDYPVFIDSESTGGTGRADHLSAGLRTSISSVFMETIQGVGLSAGIYGARSWFGQQLLMEELGNYIVWLAEYRESPLYQGYYQIWQYSSKGRVDGIEGNVDLNLSYMD